MKKEAPGHKEEGETPAMEAKAHSPAFLSRAMRAEKKSHKKMSRGGRRK